MFILLIKKSFLIALTIQVSNLSLIRPELIPIGECVSQVHITNGLKSEIKVPNSEALCVECYTLKFNKKLLPLTVFTSPGVTPVNLISLSKIKASIAKVEEVL